MREEPLLASREGKPDWHYPKEKTMVDTMLKSFPLASALAVMLATAGTPAVAHDVDAANQSGKLGTELPIIQGPMAGVHLSALAEAVLAP
jgi:hypothetical protein